MTTAVMERSGWVLFASTMFVIVGVMNIIFGLTMIINNEWIVFGAKEVWYLDISAWGWITLIVGALALVVAWGVYAGQTWARVVGIIVAVLAVIDAFLVMPYYTVWGITILALSVLVIWALAAHGDEVPAA
jgi:hypothetical protein